ncbi:MAG: UDP-N-acetylmuramoyl-tripeptide--D-alanyl-D-alanine ligase [Polaromonas sp.]|nr:UDP-N-acetylmuramoyl-tripeptide--D-alanyl-D-alanine ligase [Polaromonas sp.]
MMTLQQAMHWLPDAALVGDGGLQLARVHSDTRSILPGDLFVALHGERFDGNDFLVHAQASGAVAALASRGLTDAGLAGLQVADTRLALGQLAAGWRSQFDLPLIAVTGSNGKTTVTQMIAAILRAWNPSAAFATQGNLNNDIGVPLTLLRLRAAHRVGVVELGMNHPGEIAHLAAMVRPTVALVNNAQREHLEFMHSVEAVAAENGSVLTALGLNGTAVFPADDAYAGMWHQLVGKRRILTFGLTSPADVSVRDALWVGEGWQVVADTPAGPVEFLLRIAGRHNVKNALAAIACALAVGVPLACVASGLATFLPVNGRSRSRQLVVGGRTVTLVDDSYNANPDSMRAAISVLAELPAPRLLVMGDMGEVGASGPMFHAEAGEQAQAAGIEELFTLGAQSAQAASCFAGAQHFESGEALVAAVLAELPRVASVLVKGSRFMKMERVVRAIEDCGNSGMVEVGHAS